MRERILVAACDLLESHGPEEVSIRAVTARLGVSPMAFYSYFTSRDELLNTLGERQLRLLQESTEEFLARAQQESAIAMLREVADVFSQTAFQQPRSYLLQWVMPVEEELEIHLNRQRFETVLRFLAKLIEIGISQGEFQPTDTQKAALALFSLFNGPLLLCTSGRLSDQNQIDSLLEETQRMALQYLTAKKES